jgi:hypothetical protein
MLNTKSKIGPNERKRRQLRRQRDKEQREFMHRTDVTRQDSINHEFRQFGLWCAIIQLPKD